MVNLWARPPHREPPPDLKPPSYYCLSKKSAVQSLSYTISQDYTDGHHVRRKRLCAFDGPRSSKKRHGDEYDSQSQRSGPSQTYRKPSDEDSGDELDYGYGNSGWKLKGEDELREGLLPQVPNRSETVWNPDTRFDFPRTPFPWEENAQNAAVRPTGLRRYICAKFGCNKEFDSPAKLRIHQKTHDRPWKCPDTTFKYHDDGWPTAKEMERHHKESHPNHPILYRYFFASCTKIFKRAENCKQHMERAHGWFYSRSRGAAERRKAQASEKPSKRSTSARSPSELAKQFVDSEPEHGLRDGWQELAARSFKENTGIRAALKARATRPRTGKPTSGVLNLDSQHTLHQTRLHALPRDHVNALPQRVAADNLDVWDPTNWMLDGLLDFNDTMPSGIEGKEEDTSDDVRQNIQNGNTYEKVI